MKSYPHDLTKSQIKEGLQGDERIITEGNVGIRENQKIVVELKSNEVESPGLAKTGAPLAQDRSHMMFQ